LKSYQINNELSEARPRGNVFTFRYAVNSSVSLNLLPYSSLRSTVRYLVSVSSVIFFIFNAYKSGFSCLGFGFKLDLFKPRPFQKSGGYFKSSGIPLINPLTISKRYPDGNFSYSTLLKIPASQSPKYFSSLRLAGYCPYLILYNST
jgi:hypothetical protein